MFLLGRQYGKRSSVSSLLTVSLATTVASSFVLSPRILPARTFTTTTHLRSMSSSSSSSATTTPPHAVRVVTYNVLSSELARPSYYTTYQPEDLAAENRLPLVLQKLEQEWTKDHRANTIFCLQEVSYAWAGALHAFFANRNYYFVTGLYGRSFNGYMGVALAFPLDQYEVVDVDLCRLADVRQDGWPDRDEVVAPSPLASLYSMLVDQPLQWMGLAGEPDKKPVDPWSESARRSNVLVSAVLRSKTNKDRMFCVGTYHMPCAFWAPDVMVLHATMAAERVQQIARRHGASDNDDDKTTAIPYVLAGDFNIKPGDSSYQLLVTGELDPADPAWPKAKNGMEFSTQSLHAMESAYAEHDGHEPDFTNYARVKDDPEAFCDVLDYIFVSKGDWKVTDVLPLPHRDTSGGPFPSVSENEPSDHLLLAATVELVATRE